MNDIGNKIKLARVNKGLSYSQLAEITGLKKSTLQRYETGTTLKIPIDAIALIEKALGLERGYLMGWEDVTHSDNNEENLPIRIPIYSYIPAGIPMEAIDEIVDYEEVPASWLNGDKEFFGMKIKGDSMSPEYRDGDTVIFKKQSTCENGDDCAVMVNGNDATFKRVRRELWGIILQPLNPAYDPMSFSNEEIISKPVRIIGVFWELRRSRH